MSLFTVNPTTGLKQTCTPKKGFIPSIVPIIFNLSTNTSKAGEYQVVNITGENFRYNNTQVKFGNISNIAITYNSSFNVSFTVPINLLPGTYAVYVTTINNVNVIPNIVYSNASNYILF
jgi:5-hydroxyisourate hydrolase-like protein (transthyretin family)